MKIFQSILFLGWFIVSTAALAETAKTLNTETLVDGYVIRHVIFNSTFLQPDVAKQYHLKRSNYESLLNISVNKAGVSGGLPVAIKGTSKNLMQQQKVLEFKEINEKDTTYYLAPIRISGEETLHFNLEIDVDGQTLPLKFSHKVYAD